MIPVKQTLKKLERARFSYLGVVSQVEHKLSDNIDFDFSIFWQESDGFVIVHTDSSDNAPLDDCIEIINDKGVLKYADFPSI